MKKPTSSRPLRRALPFLNALAVFESAARLNSFTRAAAEIGISQSAVSRHVTTLEAHLGVQLFKRDHKQLTLTGPGGILQEGVRMGLETVLETVMEVRAPSAGRRIVIGCSFDTGHLSLLPLLYELKQRLGGREVQMQVSDNYEDFESPDVNLSIRYGNGDWPKHVSYKLAPEVMVPVCSTAFARAHNLSPKTTTAKDLLAYPLIQHEATARDTYDWRNWLSRIGVKPHRSLRCETFPRLMFVIDAALQGRGIALVWRHSVHRMLTEGQLVRASQEEVRTDMGVYAVWRKTRDNSELNQRIATFLAESYAEI